MKSLKNSYDDISGLVADIFVIAMFCVYPFYMESGYVGLSDAKYRFFLICGLIGVVALTITGFKKLRENLKENPLSKIQIAVIAFAIVSLISFIFSGYKTIALTGAPQWNMGLVTILLCCALFFLLSILWKPKKAVIYAALVVSAIVFILGFLDRFSVYLIPLSERNPSFISTLGNINWFVGYYSVLMPLGVGMLFMAKGRADLEKILLYVYTGIAFICGFAQGSESVFLVFAALFILLLFLTGKRIVRFDEFLIVIIIWCLSAQALRLVMRFFPKAYNYDTDGLCAKITQSSIPGILALIFIVILMMIWEGSGENGSYDTEKIMVRILWIVTALGAVSYVVISIIRTNTDLLPGITNSVFYWDSRFGSGRGEAYSVAFSSLKDLGIKGFLIGKGPDCFESFVYSIDPLRDRLAQVWPNDRLVNAHCELLTLLINEGLAGVIAYTAIFVALFKTVFKKDRLDIMLGDNGAFEDKIALIGAVAVICAFIHNFVSFAHVLNIPFMFILAGMAVASDSARKAR
ncbi:MAG: O-antigen ligase family protein [Lachnospiraceae bacterium]|nr:O-antigen ligase family protein [Lachnospiraceae bacterium]